MGLQTMDWCQLTNHTLAIIPPLELLRYRNGYTKQEENESRLAVLNQFGRSTEWLDVMF